jgi:hypothetical protein
MPFYNFFLISFWSHGAQGSWYYPGAKNPGGDCNEQTATDHLIGMKCGMGTLDNMNHLKNKRIRSVAALLQDQFGMALVKMIEFYLIKQVTFA